jgi:hypothetical protein
VHQSARDYLSGKDGQSPLDSPTQYGHLQLAMSCLSHLNRRLKPNLLNLSMPNSTWPPSSTSAESKSTKLLVGLNYAATSWIQHIHDAQRDQALQGVFIKGGLVFDFLHNRLLEWSECLALLGRLQVSVEGLEVLEVVTAAIRVSGCCRCLRQ